ncbi:hypothetical protein [Paradesulfitobacterium ferrireducens]|nr:hypothetical protein [Paradesulfitobacterium ferrireducens]
MGRKSKVSFEEKLSAVKDYLNDIRCYAVQDKGGEPACTEGCRRRR